MVLDETTGAAGSLRLCRARAWTGVVVLALVLALSAACGSDRVTLPRGNVSVTGAQIAVTDNCHDNPRLEVTESASTVEFEFSVAAETGGDCFSCTIVTLDAPVGDRAVVDVATGETVSKDGACFTELEAEEQRAASASTVAPASDTSPAIASEAESCATGTGTLRDRAFAFDGTVIASTEEVDPQYPEPNVRQPRATFEVHAWFAGGSNETVRVWMQRDVVVGERLLVTGEPRWGGNPLDDAIAWECGFSMIYSPEAAEGWALTFSR